MQIPLKVSDGIKTWVEDGLEAEDEVVRGSLGKISQNALILKPRLNDTGHKNSPYQGSTHR